MVFQWLTLAALTVERRVRSSLAKVISETSNGTKRSVRQVLKEFEKKSTFELVGQAFLDQIAYTGYPEVVEWMRDNNIGNDRIQELAHVAVSFTSFLNHRPAIANHLELLNCVMDKIKETDTTTNDPVSPDQFVQEFAFCMFNYAYSNTQLFDSMGFDSTNDYNQRHSHYSSWNSDANPPSYHQQKGSAGDIEAHKAALNKLILMLHDPNIPDAVVVQVLSVTLGNSGMTRFKPTEFPAFFCFLPYPWIYNHRDEIWERRKENDEDSDGEIPLPSDINSDFHSLIDEQIEDALATMDFNSIYDILNKLSDNDIPYVRPNNNEQAGPEINADDPNDQQPNQPQPQAQPQPNLQLPDDAAYTPDSFLGRKVRDLTQHFQNLNDMDMDHDHLTRFNINDYNPVPLLKRQVLRTDSIVFRGQSAATQKYVVTFTRQQRLPIFNPVN